MRLLHAKTFAFQEFVEDEIPKYAILSHTWGPEEVSFQEALILSDTSASPPSELASKAGWGKIQRTCERALTENLEYAWIDTCCIDKTSSAELSEAINSMFRWYENSEVCYAYLADVPPQQTWNPSEPGEGFAASRWFTRGWTLQELVAPSNIVFFAADWSSIATRHEMATAISSITGIHWSFLQHQAVDPSFERKPSEPVQQRIWHSLEAVGASSSVTKRSILNSLRGSSVAERMSWAAKRQTTRVEDIAYCLLGIFEVSMPLIYGEGAQAFIRLQKEIMRQSDDMSILAWNFRLNGRPLKPLLLQESLFDHPWKVYYSFPRYGDNCPPVSLLAGSPAAFLGCENVIPSEIGDFEVPINLSSKRLDTILPLSEDKHPHVVLPCRLKDNPAYLISIPLVRRGANTFARAKFPTRLVNHRVWNRWQSSPISLFTDVDDYESRPVIPDYSFWIKELPAGFELSEVHPSLTYTPSRRIIAPHGPAFAEQPNGGQVMAGIRLKNQQHGGQSSCIVLHATKLYDKGFWWARPVRMTYRIIPSREDRQLQALVSPVVDEVAWEPLQYEITSQGLLYVTLQRQFCLGKPLFAVTIKHECRSLQAWWLRLQFDIKIYVIGQLRDCLEVRPLRNLVCRLSRIFLAWEDIAGALISIMTMVLAFGAIWTGLGLWTSHSATKSSTAVYARWIFTIGGSILHYRFTLMTLPYLSLPFPTASSMIRKFRLLIAAAESTPIFFFQPSQPLGGLSLLMISLSVVPMLSIIAAALWVRKEQF